MKTGYFMGDIGCLGVCVFREEEGEMGGRSVFHFSGTVMRECEVV
jgi:hypothetical protein